MQYRDWHSILKIVVQFRFSEVAMLRGGGNSRTSGCALPGLSYARCFATMQAGTAAQHTHGLRLSSVYVRHLNFCVRCGRFKGCIYMCVACTNASCVRKGSRAAVPKLGRWLRVLNCQDAKETAAKQAVANHATFVSGAVFSCLVRCRGVHFEQALIG